MAPNHGTTVMTHNHGTEGRCGDVRRVVERLFNDLEKCLYERLYGGYGSFNVAKRLWKGCGEVVLMLQGDCSRVWRGCGEVVLVLQRGCGEAVLLLQEGCFNVAGRSWRYCREAVAKNSACKQV